MEQKKFPEVDLLLDKLKDKYKRGEYTTNDYKSLSVAIADSGAGYISVSTLKRIFGYVNDHHKPTMTTLDIIARYVGYGCYEEFYKEILGANTVTSAFLADNQIWSKDLNIDDIVEVGWAPNRYLQLRYIGKDQYQVVQAKNTKLLVGDTFKVVIFVLGEPLYLDAVYRGDLMLGPYVAGVRGGVITLNKI